MADASRNHAWSIASSQMALLAEVHRNHKKRHRPYKPAEFNPLIASQSRSIPITVTQLGELLNLAVQCSSPSADENGGGL